MKIITATKHSALGIFILATALFFVSAVDAQTRENLGGTYKIVGYSFSDKRTYPIEKMEVTLIIDRDLKFGGRSACNLYSGSLALGAGRSLKLAAITTTEMACNELNGSFEGEFMNVLSKADRYDQKGKTLTLTDMSTGHFLRFENVAAGTEPPSENEQARHEILYVSNRTVKCPVISPQRCLLVKKGKSGSWKKYYDSIIDFDPRSGRFYKIEVERFGDPPSGLPGDVSVYRHKLVRVIRSSVRERDIYR